MHGIVFRWLALTASIIAAAYLLDGIHINGFFSAFFAAAMLGILNAILRQLALVITLPINVLTLGLFTFVINALMLKMASAVITGFDVDGFWSAIFGSLIISAISWLLNSFVNERGSVAFQRVDPGTRHPNRTRPDKQSKNTQDTIDSKNNHDTIDLENKGDHWE